MTQRELQKSGRLYKLDDTLWNAHLNAKRLTRLLNATLETERPKRMELVQQLFAQAGEGSYIEPPFHCDYGCNTYVGKNFYCNYDCVFLDCGDIRIGDNVIYSNLCRSACGGGNRDDGNALVLGGSNALK